MFVYVLGDALGAGLSGGYGIGTSYVDYLTPGIVLTTVCVGAVPTAVAVAMDMKEGIVARFRTMPIFQPALLVGLVVGSVIQTLLSVALVIAVAVLLGFRPTAGPLEWLAATGVVAMVALAVTWLSVALGLVAREPEAASSIASPFLFLPIIGSGLVPTDAMPAGLAWFAAHQPFTPIIETLRGLLMGTPIGNDAWVSIVWCTVLSVIGYLWAKREFTRDRQ